MASRVPKGSADIHANLRSASKGQGWCVGHAGIGFEAWRHLAEDWNFSSAASSVRHSDW